MATMTKFGFDTRFDIEPPRREKAVEPAAPPPPLITKQDLAAAREEGFAAGREAGLADAAAAVEARLAEALSALAEQIGALGPGYQEALAACRIDAVGIARTIVRKTLTAMESQVALPAVEQMIAGFLPRLLDEPRIVVRVNDELLDALQARIRSLAEGCGYNGGIVLLAEPGTALPDCRIEWADGGAEKDSAALWREIDGAIENYLEAAGAHRGAATEPVPEESEFDTDALKSEEKPDG